MESDEDEESKGGDVETDNLSERVISDQQVKKGRKEDPNYVINSVEKYEKDIQNSETKG